MNLQAMASSLALSPLTEVRHMDRQVTGCYVGDLLSCAMKNARHGDLWLTVQSHPNVVAVAVLLELAGVVVTEGATVDQATVDRANAEGIPLLASALPSFPLAGRIWELGIRTPE